MIIYGKTKDGLMVKFPYTFAEFLADNSSTNYAPDANFVALFNDTEAYSDGFRLVEVEASEGQEHDTSLERLVLGEPVLKKGAWTVGWVAVQHTEEERVALWELHWKQVRRMRNERLAECDWTQLPDAPVDAEAWAEYRQALRDITDAADPFAVVWPTAPQA
jgi:hypothetical protein